MYYNEDPYDILGTGLWQDAKAEVVKRHGHLDMEEHLEYARKIYKELKKRAKTKEEKKVVKQKEDKLSILERKIRKDNEEMRKMREEDEKIKKKMREHARKLSRQQLSGQMTENQKKELLRYMTDITLPHPIQQKRKLRLPPPIKSSLPMSQAQSRAEIDAYIRTLPTEFNDDLEDFDLPLPPLPPTPTLYEYIAESGRQIPYNTPVFRSKEEYKEQKKTRVPTMRQPAFEIVDIPEAPPLDIPEEEKKVDISELRRQLEFCELNKKLERCITGDISYLQPNVQIGSIGSIPSQGNVPSQSSYTPAPYAPIRPIIRPEGPPIIQSPSESRKESSTLSDIEPRTKITPPDFSNVSLEILIPGDNADIQEENVNKIINSIQDASSSYERENIVKAIRNDIKLISNAIIKGISGATPTEVSRMLQPLGLKYNSAVIRAIRQSKQDLGSGYGFVDYFLNNY